MPGFSPENINIHDLTIEEPEKQEVVTFDPERDITEEDWQKMKGEFLENMKGAEYIGQKLNYLNRAVELVLLFPERSDELNLDDKLWEELKETYKVDSRYFAEVTMKVKILFPEKLKELSLNDKWAETKWNRAKEDLRAKRENDNPSDFLELAMQLKVVFPERVKELHLDKYDVAKAEKFLAEQKYVNNWYNFMLTASNLKILYPERVNELHLDDDFWEQTAGKFRKTKYAYDIPLSDFASSLKILAAEKIDITSKGLEFTMPKPKESLEISTPPMPEIKSF